MIVVTSGVSAWLAIKFFITLIERTGMLPYVIYRVLLGIFLIVFFYD
jgi:undecaprenyl-diphosphatase